MNTTIITGASDGIGAEMARQLARQHGAQAALVLAARNAELLEAVAKQCAALGAQVLVVPTDVSVQAQCRALVEQTVQRFGRVDALINNAGISAQALFSDVKAEDLA
ncbi:MAG: SDR family NAD(P)-dependent oxidoreductase, partial [Rhodoferax sp.]